MKKQLIAIILLASVLLTGCTNQIILPNSKTIKVIKKQNNVINGKRLYKKKCNKTKKRFAKKSNAKKFLVRNNMCKNLNNKQLNRVACHLSKHCNK